MTWLRLSVSAATVSLLTTGGLAAVGAQAAEAEECTGLVTCTTKNVGDTVDKATKGDVEGTVKQTGKTVGDTVDQVGKTTDKVTRPKPPPRDQQPPADDDPPPSDDDPPPSDHDSGGDHGDGNGSSDHGSNQHSEKAGHHDQARYGTTSASAAEIARWVSVGQWSSGPRVPVGDIGGGVGRSTRTGVDVVPGFGDRKVQPPEVAAPPEERESKGRDDGRRVNGLDTDAVAASSPAGDRPVPQLPIFVATVLSGTVGIAVVSQLGRRRSGRR